MAEYIEREALKQNIRIMARTTHPELVLYSSVQRIISNYPAADVVEVVRCKDCKYVSLYCGSYSCCNSQTPWFNDEFNIDVGADDFCSYGIKRGEEK